MVCDIRNCFRCCAKAWGRFGPNHGQDQWKARSGSSPLRDGIDTASLGVSERFDQTPLSMSTFISWTGPCAGFAATICARVRSSALPNCVASFRAKFSVSRLRSKQLWSTMSQGLLAHCGVTPMGLMRGMHNTRLCFLTRHHMAK